MAYFHLNQIERSIEVEKKILTDIPFSGAPKGYEISIMLSIVMDRLYRKEERSVESLIGQIKARPEAEQLSAKIAAVECDLAFLKGEFSEALPYYCQLWKQAYLSGHSSVLCEIKEKLNTIRENIGALNFDVTFSEYAASGVPNPFDADTSDLSQIGEHKSYMT